MNVGHAFVAKIDPTGSTLLYSTFLGGSNNTDVGQGIAVDAKGNAYITSLTYSTDFPTLNPYQTTGNAFVTALNSSGSGLIYSTYIAGTYIGNAIAVSRSGTAYVTGQAYSPDFSATTQFVKPPLGSCCSYSADAFVARVNITNNGSVIIDTLQVSVSGTTLGTGTLLVAPPPVTNLAPGASAVVRLTFPANSLASCKSGTLKVAGNYDVSSLIPALDGPQTATAGNWTLSFAE